MVSAKIKKKTFGVKPSQVVQQSADYLNENEGIEKNSNAQKMRYNIVCMISHVPFAYGAILIM